MDWIRIAGGTGFIGVALGAFGAHALRDRVTPEMLAIWQTGVLYHLVHAVVLLALALYARASGADIRWPARFFLSGILVFSGSLYALVLSGVRILGAVTPLGGVALLIGWGWVCVCLSRRPGSKAI